MIRNALLAGVVGLACSTTATASIIFLSDLSSDVGVDAADLDASMNFDVIGLQVILTVTNLTTVPEEWNMSELYFNGPDDLVMTFDGRVGWDFSTNQVADGFGTFDFALIDGVGGDPSQIAPGEVQVFNFTIQNGNPLMQDFVTMFSAGGTSAIVAGKFRRESGELAYGATVPGPAALALFGVAGMMGRRRRRRR